MFSLVVPEVTKVDTCVVSNLYFAVFDGFNTIYDLVHQVIKLFFETGLVLNVVALSSFSLRFVAVVDAKRPSHEIESIVDETSVHEDMVVVSRITFVCDLSSGLGFLG